MSSVQQKERKERPKLGELTKRTIETCGGVLAIVSKRASASYEEWASEILPAISTDERIDLVLACCMNQNDVPTLLMLTDHDTAEQWKEAGKWAAVPVVADPAIPEELAATAAEYPSEEELQRAEADWKAVVRKWADRAREEHSEAREKAYEAQMEKYRILPADDVADSLETLTEPWEPIPTGLAGVDEALDGGLPSSGLVMIGAMSSTGKTTLVLQIADHIASEEGREVLYVACEQSARELVAMSISRTMMEQTDHGAGYELCPYRDILRADKREKWSAERRGIFERAYGTYSLQTGPHMNFLEPDEQPTMPWIAKRAAAVARHSKSTGRKPPVVVIDYLQLLAPKDPRMSDKAAIDANVSDMRRLARKLGVCIIAISAFGRASYDAGAAMSSFRESSTIEYSADLLLGWQPAGMKAALKGLDEKEAKKKAHAMFDEYGDANPKMGELVVLKNRSGARHAPVPLKFFASASRFVSVKGGKPGAEQKRTVF